MHSTEPAGLLGLLRRLVAEDVAFVVIGGYAAAAHGVTLVTQDLDICCAFTPSNLLKLQAAIADLNPVHRITPQRVPLKLTEDSCTGLRNLYLATDWGPLDCLGKVAGLGEFNKVAAVAEAVDLGDSVVRMLSLDAMIRAKEAMDRPRDREAVLQLRAIRESNARA